MSQSLGLRGLLADLLPALSGTATGGGTSGDVDQDGRGSMDGSDTASIPSTAPGAGVRAAVPPSSARSTVDARRKSIQLTIPVIPETGEGAAGPSTAATTTEEAAAPGTVSGDSGTHAVAAAGAGEGGDGAAAAAWRAMPPRPRITAAPPLPPTVPGVINAGPAGGGSGPPTTRRRSSTGGGPIRSGSGGQSPLVSPMSIVSSAAQAALLGAVHFSHGRTLSGGIMDRRESLDESASMPSPGSPTTPHVTASTVLAGSGTAGHRPTRTDSAGSFSITASRASPNPSFGNPAALNTILSPPSITGFGRPPADGRRRNSILAFVAAAGGGGRRSSETSLASTNDMFPPSSSTANAPSPSPTDDDGAGGGGAGVGTGGTGVLDASMFVSPAAAVELRNAAGVPELVDTAMVGLLRVVHRFHTLFEEGGGLPGGPRASPQRTLSASRGHHASQSTSSMDVALASLAGGPLRGPRASGFGVDANANNNSGGGGIGEGRRVSEHSRTSSVAALAMEEGGSGGGGGSGGATTAGDGDSASDVASDDHGGLGGATGGRAACAINISRDDLDVLTSLVDVLTVAWSGGFLVPMPAPVTLVAPTASGGATVVQAGYIGPLALQGEGSGGDEGDGSGYGDVDGAAMTGVSDDGDDDEVVVVDGDGHEEPGGMRGGGDVGRGGVARPPRHTLRPGHPRAGSVDGGVAGGGVGGVPSTSGAPFSPMSVAAMGGLLRRASAAVGTDHDLMALLSPGAVVGGGGAGSAPHSRRGSLVLMATMTAEGGAERSHPTTPLLAATATMPTTPSVLVGVSDGAPAPASDGGGPMVTAAGTSAGVGGAALPGRRGPRPSTFQVDGGEGGAASASAVSAATTSALASNAATPGGGSRHRSTRTMAKEELQRSFMANPAIFDESTREYVSSLVSPDSLRTQRTAKDRLRAGVAKVARVAALAKRLSSLKDKTPAGMGGGSGNAGPVGGGGGGGRLDAVHEDGAVGVVEGDTSATARGRRRSSVAIAIPGSTANITSSSDPADVALLRRVTSPDAHVAGALEGMANWDFDVIAANTKLLYVMGCLPSQFAPPPGMAGVPSTLPASTATMPTDATDTVFIPPPSPASSRMEPISAVVAHVERQSTGAGRRGSSGGGGMVVGDGKFCDIPNSGSGLGTEMLVVLTSAALEMAGVVDDLLLDKDSLFHFLARIARGYHDQPYHNALHGADVTQAVYYVLSTGGLGARLSSEHKLALLLSAAVHDVGHPGYNNIFLSQTQHPLALTYNDRSPLENMHAATAFLTMRRTGCDVLASLSVGQRTEIRSVMIDAILATDNAHHFKMVGKIRRRIARAMRAVDGGGGGAGNKASGDDDDYTSSDEGLDHGPATSDAITHPLDPRKLSDARLLLSTTLHACDISNPAREWEVYGRWTDRITEEFWMQGDKLKEAGLPVLPMNDRLRPISRPNFQAGFITALVLPLWSLLVDPVFLQVMDTRHIVARLKGNLTRYTDMIAAAKAAPPAPAPAPPPPPPALADGTSAGSTSDGTSGSSS